MKKEIIIVTCYCNTPEKLEILENLLKVLKKNNKKILLVTHLPIPDYFIKYLELYFYDQDNEIIRDYKYMGYANLNTDCFSIKTKDVVDGSTSLAVLRLVFMGFNIAKMNGYDIVHHLEYDTCISGFEQIDDNYKLINTGYGSICYKNNDWFVGNYFTIDISLHNYMDASKESILKKLELYNICERVIYESYIKDYNPFIKSDSLINQDSFQIQLISSGFLRWITIAQNNGLFYIVSYNPDIVKKSYTIIADEISFSYDLEYRFYNIKSIEPGTKKISIFCNNLFVKCYNLLDIDQIKKINQLTNLQFH